MSNFISTSGGKIVNINAIAFITTRHRKATGEGRTDAVQLVVGFSSAASVGEGRLMPLSLVMEGAEALEFLDELAGHGVTIHHLREKLG